MKGPCLNYIGKLDVRTMCKNIYTEVSWMEGQ